MFQDLRVAIRGLVAAPGFTLAAVLTLALGIGGNTAIFSVVDGVLLRPTPLADLGRLVMVWETDRNSGTTREPASVPDFLDFAERARSVEDPAAITGLEFNVVAERQEPVRLVALGASARLLPILGIDPVVGRHFTEDEDRAGGPPVVLISESLWSRFFGRAGDVVGRTLRVDEIPYTVIGVVPDFSDFGVRQVFSAAAYARSFVDRGDRAAVDLWVPLRPDPRASPRLPPSSTRAGRGPGGGTQGRVDEGRPAS